MTEPRHEAAPPLYVLATYRVLPSWLVLGPSGREHAVRGALEIEAALEEAGGGTDAFVCRGLSAHVDLALLHRAPTLEAHETYARAFTTRTLGRHLTLESHRLCAADAPPPQGPLMLFAAVRGPVEAFEQRALCGLEPATDAALFSTMGPHPGDLLLAAAAHDHGALLRFFHALTTFEPLAATPVDRLAMGRRLKMEEALACFA